MEPKEDLSFKPINEGLGFHRKKVELKEKMHSARVVQDAIGKSLPQKPRTEAPVLKAPLPRKDSVSSVQPPTKDVIDELVRNFKKPHETFIEEPEGVKVVVPPVRPLIDEFSYPLPWMMSPFFVDAMLVIALVLSALLLALVVTKADLLNLIMQSPSDLEFWMTFPAITLGMTFTYMTLTRLFLGSSLGELVFEVQLGTNEQRGRLNYGFQVALRSLCSILTGYFFLPLLSMIMKTDYLGIISGLRLYRKKR